MKARAIVCYATNAVRLDEFELPEPGDGEVLTETLFTAVSPGTEARVLAGSEPGSDARPLIIGYANVGRILRTGAGVDVAPGTLVIVDQTRRASLGRLWGGHVSHAVRPAAGLLAVPEGVRPEDAVLSKLAAISHHGYDLANARTWEKVACIGLGPIGLLSAMFHTLGGSEVLALDRSAARVALAREAGVDAMVVDDELPAVVRRRFPQGADVVVDCTGVASVLAASSRCLREPAWGISHRTSPRLVLQGSYPGDLTLNYRELFTKETTVLLPRDAVPDDRRAVLELMRRRKLQVAALRGDPVPPEAAPEIYRQLRERPDERLTAVFGWS